MGAGLHSEAVSLGDCSSPGGSRNGVVPHLVVPCAGDKLLRLGEELYVVVPDGNPQVKPVIPNLVGWADGDRVVGGSVCPFLQPIIIIP